MATRHSEEKTMEHRPFGSRKRDVAVIGQGTWNIEQADSKTAIVYASSVHYHWYPVAATLRRLGHQQQQYRVASDDAGFVAQAKSRVAGYAVTAMTMQRLRSVAQPLINELTEEQKEAGRTVLAYGAASRALPLSPRRDRLRTRHPPSRAGGCPALTFPSCPRANCLPQNQIGCC